MLIFIFPVSVFISHLPPPVVFGTFIRPVLLSAKKIFSERRFPLTLPVLVFIEISLASASSKVTLPVLLLTVSFSEAKTFVRDRLPVLPSEVRCLQLTELKTVFPVVALRVISSSQVTSVSDIFPVVVLMLNEPTVGAEKLTFPVLRVISAELKLKLSGTVTLPVLFLTASSAYSVFGR